MDLGLKGRPALVAAASRGIGKAVARSLAEEGARLAICSRDAGAVAEARDEIAAATRAEVVAITADVAIPDGAVGFVREGAEALGGCEILVTNAGGPRPGRFDELSDDDFSRALEANFLSATRMAREAIPLMRDAGYGRIVAIASSGVKEPIPGLMLSNAARAALIGWARTLVGEVARDGITVNAVLPHRVRTDRIRQLVAHEAEERGSSLDEAMAEVARAVPVGRFGEPREVGDLVAYLCSDRAGYLTGCFIQVDGGAYRGLL